MYGSVRTLVLFLHALYHAQTRASQPGSLTGPAWRCNVIGCMGQSGNGPRFERFGTRLAKRREYWAGTGPVTRVI